MTSWSELNQRNGLVARKKRRDARVIPERTQWPALRERAKKLARRICRRLARLEQAA